MKIFNRKFPHYRQNNACDCGPTCLRMITRHYRHEYSAEMLRRECHTSRGGVNMLDISEAAAHIGFETAGVKLTFGQLAREGVFPCILYWNQNHFVVCYSIERGRDGEYRIHISDPASQRLTYTREEFERCWSGVPSCGKDGKNPEEGEKGGVALLLEPGEKFGTVKDCDPYLRFVFLTGITKFSQLSIFSELNNLKNISMRPDYAGVCGITKEEMLTQMSDYIDDFASYNQTTRDEAIRGLKQQYDGYHFTWPSPDIFNPYSLLNAFQDHELTNYWFSSGTPTYLIEMMRKFNVVPSHIRKNRALASAFDAPTERMKTILPFLYQSGYITIKDYNRNTGIYTLDIPNIEIRVGLMESLLPNYVAEHADDGGTMIGDMYEALLGDDLDEMLRLLQAYLLTVPYCNNANSEGHYQQMLYVIFSLLERYVDVEVRTPTGRVDMVLRTQKMLYLFELKQNKSAQTAMNQIDLKDYASKFARCGLPVTKVGINFDAERHTISDWKIEDAPDALGSPCLGKGRPFGPLDLFLFPCLGEGFWLVGWAQIGLTSYPRLCRPFRAWAYR